MKLIEVRMEAGSLQRPGWRLEVLRGQDGGWKSREARMKTGSLLRSGWKLEDYREAMIEAGRL